MSSYAPAKRRKAGISFSAIADQPVTLSFHKKNSPVRGLLIYPIQTYLLISFSCICYIHLILQMPEQTLLLRRQALSSECYPPARLLPLQAFRIQESLQPLLFFRVHKQYQCVLARLALGDLYRPVILTIASVFSRKSLRKFLIGQVLYDHICLVAYRNLDLIRLL